jgi:hypothetical protein
MKDPIWPIVALLALAALAPTASAAEASETRIRDGLAAGTIKTDTEIVLPPRPPSDQSPPFPGSEQESAGFLVKLTKEQEKNIVNKAFPLLLVKWPFNFVAVCWENPSSDNEKERGWVQASIVRTWQKYSALKFSQNWAKCAPDNQGVRIRIADDGPHVKYLGKDLNGRADGMVLNFTFAAWSPVCANPDKRKLCIESIAVHEFGHAIGFAHEQNRPDAPGECAKRRQGNDGDTINITPWDLHSVMNYCNPIYNNNGMLSEFDIKAVQYIYGAPR